MLNAIDFVRANTLADIQYNSKKFGQLLNVGRPFIGDVKNPKCSSCISDYYYTLKKHCILYIMERSIYKFKDKKLSYRLSGSGKVYNHLHSTEEEMAYLYSVRPELFEEIQTVDNIEDNEVGEGSVKRKRAKK